jgi:hypothetical protein
MFAYSSRFLTLFWILSFCVLGGCGSKPVLETKSPAVPAGVDLTGYWSLRNDSRAGRRRDAAGSDETLVLMTGNHSRERSNRQRSASGASAHIFLEFGESLKITQTHYGVFVSYDRSIVEEFTFGENRLVTVGPIEATRVSGWEGNGFVVETLDDTATTLYETWHVEEGGSILIRDIRISQSDHDSFVLQQVFDRSPDR